ncbi:MAG: TolC family protein [Bacteroidales bacterium]|nr:TolC family protein [Bacteroidales bacterium]
MKRILLIALATCSLPLCAQTTLQECRRLAREHYPAMRQYELIEKTRELTLENASKPWLPQIIVGAQASWQSAVATFPEQMTTMLAASGLELPGIRQDQYQISLNVSQTLWDGGQSKAEKELAEALSRVDAGSLDVDFYALEERVDELYFGALMLKWRMEQAEALKSLLQSNLDQVRSMIRGGVAMQSDADALEAELLGAEENIASLSTARENYLQALSLFTGERIEVLHIPEMPSRMEGFVRPELSLLDERLDALDLQKRLVKTATMPRFSLYAQGWYGYPGLDMFRSMTSPDWTWNAIVGVRMTWNVSAFFTQGNSLRKLDVARGQAQVQRDLFKFNTSLQESQQSRELSYLEEIVSRDERIAQLRRNVREAAESKYRGGVIGLNDLLKAITDENNAETSRRGHELELLKTAYQINHNAL